MSSGQCQTGDTQGFPLTLSQNLFKQWTNYDKPTVEQKLSESTIPTDYSVNWQPVPTKCNITVRPSSVTGGGVLITGLDSYLSNTTITYGGAIYTCRDTISIVQNQHPSLNDGRQVAKFEVILPFRIRDSQTANANPSSPHIILLCRPLVYTPSVINTPFWSAVDKAATIPSGSFSNTQNSITTDISSIYSIDKSNLLPAVSYKTCIPANLHGASTVGSVKVYVNVIIQPLLVNLSSTNLTTLASKYKIPLNIGDLLSDKTSERTSVHFPISLNTFSTDPSDNLKITLPGPSLSDFDTVLQTIQILAPESMIGNPLNQITKGTNIPSTNVKKPYKCYTIDPKKDIVDGQIMVDPSTGEKLSEAQARAEFANDINIDTNINTETGIMPGDVEYAISVTVTVLGTLGLLGYLLFIVLKGRTIFNTGAHLIPGGMNEVLYHVLIFTMVLIGLIVFGALILKPTEPNTRS